MAAGRSTSRTPAPETSSTTIFLLNNNPSHGSIDTVSTDSHGGFSSDYNVVMDRFTPDDNNFQTLAQWRAGTGQDQHSFVATQAQLFTNASNNDFSLSGTSPAIDAGAAAASPLQPPSYDLLGNARPQGAGYDLGAYELGQSGTPVDPPPTVMPALTPEQMVAAGKAQLATDLAARLTALGADRKTIASTHFAADLPALANDRRAMATDRKDATKLAADKQQLVTHTAKMKTDVQQAGRGGSPLSAAALESGSSGFDRLALRNDLKQLAISRRTK